MAWLARGPLVLLASSAPLAGGFSPFSGLEELKPRRLHDFCEASDGKSKLRRCSHRLQKRLDDGGDVNLHWDMLVDPDTILSLDTEAEHGVLIAECSPHSSDEHHHHLQLELPATHAAHAAEGKFIVGSRFAHGCNHIGDESLYHRIVEVQHHETRGNSSGPRKSHVLLRTKRVPSLAHVVPRFDFHFSWMPAEARDIRQFPEMRTDFGQHKQKDKRRLMSLNPLTMLKEAMKEAQSVDGVETDDGGFVSSKHSSGKVEVGDTMLNFHPKQLSNLGWNWNFEENSTEDPVIDLDAPGTRGKIHIRNPYAKIHAGLFLNHSSSMEDLTKPPKVDWRAGLDGHGDLQMHVFAYLNTTGDAGVDPFSIYNFPMLKELEAPRWFDKIDFATGNLPLSMQPGVQFNGKMYHKGAFKGAVAGGIRTHAIMKPVMEFSSSKGFQMTCDGCSLQDSDIWPPMWIIFTKQFECGFAAMPQVLLKGDFGGLEQATMGFEMRPYVNITVTRGENLTEGGDVLQLVAYPFRVMGLGNPGFQTRYKVKVTFAGTAVETSSGVNWGTVTFHDYVSQFSFGNMPQQPVLQQNMTVALYEVDDEDAEKLLGTGSFMCTSLVSGECHPAPSVVPILVNGQEVAAVELAAVWNSAPEPWFASHIRGVAISFPSVELKQDLVDKIGAGNGTAGRCSIQFSHDGRTFLSNVTDVSGTMRGQTTLVFAPAFVHVWQPCPQFTSKCISPEMHLVCDGSVVAEALVPSLDATSETAMQGTAREYDLAGGKGSGLDVPFTVALTAPGNPASAPLAIVRLSAHITSIMSSGQFLQPREATEISSGDSKLLTWMVPDVDTSAEYQFMLQALKLVSSLPAGEPGGRKVGDQYLLPAGKPATYSSLCQATAIKGMGSAEAPCSFSTMFTFSNKYFDAGDIVVMMVQWLGDGGITFAMRSPPFQITKAASRRRLEVDEGEHLVHGVPLRRLQNAEDDVMTDQSGEDALEDSTAGLSPKLKAFKDKWNQQVTKYQTGCNKRNLKFKMGSGFMVRGKVTEVKVPQGFPMMGGLDQAPMVTTGWRSLMRAKNGSNLQDVLGKSMCAAGLCDGALPGCRNFTDESFKKVNVPTINIGFNRNMTFSDPNKSTMLKNALAYAFSMLPQMVDVAIKDLNKSGAFRHSTSPPDSDADAGDPDAQPILGAPKGSTAAVSPPPAPPLEMEIPEDNQDQPNVVWHTTKESRRLEAETSRSHATIRFKDDAPYEITPELLDMMIEQGYFKEVETVRDDHFHEKGPLQVTSFWLDWGEPLHMEQAYSLRSSAPAQQGPPQRPHTLALRLVAIVAGACLVAAVWALVTMQRSARDIEADDDPIESETSRALE